MAIRRMRRPLLLLVLLAPLWIAVSQADDAESSRPEFELVHVRGRVGWLGDAMREQFGLQVTTEASERTLALTTLNGEVLPLLEDSRGRAFRLDERLRTMDVELLVRRYQKTPLLQVLQVFEVNADGGLDELDYWCDICAIAMYELKACDCCQGPIELRRRPVKP